MLVSSNVGLGGGGGGGGNSLITGFIYVAITLKVFTSDPSVFFEELFESGKGTTAGQIKEVVLSRLQLPRNSDVFSLWLVSKHLRT